MGHLPALINDLALILVLAGIVTLLFKRLKQPLILGYIIVGFIAGPHIAFTPSVADESNVSTWADIGVIFLMFTLGLEFSFKKILKMGSAPFIAACTIIFCMIGLGSICGHFFGWSRINSLFLGGMLAMSSTTVIYKALTDMGYMQHRFASSVMSVLVIEDILGILLMVVLSTIAMSNSFQGIQLAGSLLQLALVLVVWFVVGVFIIPTFLSKARPLMSSETLLIVSLGLCFLMVVLAVKLHYSSAFGAFMAGSILAETIEAEDITKVVQPVKDLFGAIFFVSVGMLVDPQIIVQYWFPILVLILAILVGQAVFGTFGYLLSGQPLKVAMQCGFSMAQIGEFAFIIASLGNSLHVTAHFLYPVVVAVSVITTFLTPYMIRLAGPAYGFVEKHLPGSLKHTLNQTSGIPSVNSENAWKRLLRALFKQVIAYGFLSCAVGFAVQEGLLSVQDKVVGFFQDDELPPVEARTERLLNLTVHDLLRMSSGFDNERVDRRNSDNWARDFLAIPQTWEPGSRFHYNSMNSYLLSVIVSRVTGEKVNDYLQPRLFTPLAIESHEWQQSPQGYNAGGWGMYITTESLAKISLFVLQKGVWNGKRLLDAAWFDEACSPQIMEYAGEDITPEEAAVKYAGDQWNMGYGYQFWMDDCGGCRLDGARGQFGIVMPDKNAVIATTADVRNNKILFYSAWKHIHDLL